MDCMRKLGIIAAFLLVVTSYRNYGMEDQRKADILHAVHQNDCFTIKKLLDEGVDVNTVCLSTGITLLMIAASNGLLDAAQCLLNHPKIAINQQTDAGFTALLLAQDCSTIQMLLNHGANSNTCTFTMGDTALISAVRGGKADVVQCLVNDTKIVIDQRNNFEETALLIAIGKKDKVIIKLLLDAGADPELIDRNGITPRNLAINNKSDAEILSLINKAIIRKHGGVNPFIKAQK